MSPYQKIDVGLAQWTVQALGRLALTFGLVIGIFILVGGEARFGGRSFASALTYPGAPDSWGWVAFLSGLVGLLASLSGRHKWVWWALMVLAIWSGFFAISFAQTALEDPQASTTGMIVYGYVGISSVILGVAHRISARS